MSAIPQNLQVVRESIHAAAHLAGRHSHDVLLLAVSKNFETRLASAWAKAVVVELQKLTAMTATITRANMKDWPTPFEADHDRLSLEMTSCSKFCFGITSAGSANKVSLFNFY